jgi:hypothetical protein
MKLIGPLEHYTYSGEFSNFFVPSRPAADSIRVARFGVIAEWHVEKAQFLSTE